MLGIIFAILIFFLILLLAYQTIKIHSDMIDLDRRYWQDSIKLIEGKDD